MRRTLHFNTSGANHQSPWKSVQHPSVDTDSDEYGSFDQEELEVLNNILEVHSLPQQQAVVTASPPSYPVVFPKSELKPFSQPISYPTLQVSTRSVQSTSGEAFEGQFDDPEEEPEDDVEASEHGFQKPYIQHLRSQPDARDDVLEIQYESVVQSSTTEENLPAPTTPIQPLRTGDSPFTRFRGLNRGLSVTDLLSNTWCEQQFEYYLVRGKKRTTPAMKAGTKIHKKLEREVHETVAVKVLTPEDRWGLKLLNIIQGLRTLRETGMTRELPVFAFVKGMFVQGVIDEVSYTKPIEKVYTVPDEGSSSASDNGGGVSLVETPKKRGRKKKENIDVKQEESQKQQPLLTNFFTSVPTTTNLKVAHISDCKTRLRDSLPTTSQFRGTELQLMLYHFLLATMAASVHSAAEIYFNDAPDATITNNRENLFSQLFAARNLDPYTKFTDEFIAQMTPLLDETDPDTDSDSIHPINSAGVIRFPTLTHLTDNPTLSGLVHLLSMSFSMSIPSLSNTLSVSYRSQQTSRILATKPVEYSEARMQEHLVDVLQWWQGQRATMGVPIEEAWKCRSCEWADECEWRLRKIDELRSVKKKEKGDKSEKGKSKVVASK